MIKWRYNFHVTLKEIIISMGVQVFMFDTYHTLSQTGSTLARTNLSPFARCTLGLNRHSPAIFIKIFYAITACMIQGCPSRKYFRTNREMVNFQKLDFLQFFTTNSVTTGAD